jgi:peptide/nickel transport system substrate-binding protein
MRRTYVINTRRSKRLIALAVGLSLVAAACGDDDDDDAEGTPDETTEETTEVTTEATTEATTEGTTEGTEATDTTAAGGGEAGMVVTVDLNPDAVWDDGSPITVADLECTWLANLNTPGSLSTVGFDKIISVEEGENANQAVISFTEPFAAYKTLFNPILKSARHEDCNDVSLDFEDTPPDSARQYMIESWSPTQSIFVPNENYYGDDPAVAERVVMVPLADSDTEIASIKAGEVDFIYPQFFAGIQDALADPNIAVKVEFGGDYEALYFQMLDGPFADPVYREAFSKSIDRDALFQQIYVPIEATAEMLNCGPIVPGPYCDNADAPFGQTFDPEGATALLEENGWTKNADGFWASPDGTVPEVRWIVNTGNTRRESTQAYLIPLLQAAGFNVRADNCDAACYFQQRLPALDYDLAMYISTAPPDPTYLTPSFTCNQIPTEDNGFVGQNTSGWCNEEASAALEEADVTIDEDARAELIKTALQAMAEDYVLLPLFQFPKSGAYRTDRVGPAETVEGDLNNYRAFSNFQEWEDVDGDGQIIIGAEQWPECLNPITECANSSWYVWTVAFPTLPGLWDTTNDSLYETTELVVGEPTVEVIE